MVYATSGRPTAAVIDESDAIIDTKLYWVPCRTVKEASYLSAVINSYTVWQAVIPITTKNWAGDTRDLHKHIWRLPIPEYDEMEALHREIVAAARNAAAGAERVLSDVRAQRDEQGKPTTVTVARREIRKWLKQSEEGQEVERLVAQLLGDASVSETEGG